MPKPVIGKKTKKKVGKPTKKKSVLSSAEEKVEEFNAEYQRLLEMREGFEEDFPDAAKALKHISQQEDFVRELIKEAHVLVQKAKTSVGPFSLQRKFSAAGYNTEKFTDICAQLEDPSTIVDLLTQGVIKAIIPDNGTRKAAGRAVTFLARNPELADLFADAWQEEMEKTPAVTDPKI